MHSLRSQEGAAEAYTKGSYDTLVTGCSYREFRLSLQELRASTEGSIGFRKDVWAVLEMYGTLEAHKAVKARLHGKPV